MKIKSSTVLISIIDKIEGDRYRNRNGKSAENLYLFVYIYNSTHKITILQIDCSSYIRT